MQLRTISSRIMRCYEALRDKDQAFFGIDVQIDGAYVLWEAAILRLQWLTSMHCPSERAGAVADILDLLPLIYKQAIVKHHRRVSSGRTTPLTGDRDNSTSRGMDRPAIISFTADRILPIFLYVVVQAAIPNIAVIRREMQMVRHQGTCEYALVTLDAAIEGILSMADE